MLEPPDLPDDLLLTAVHASYGLALTALTFLPLGRDSAAWAYRAETAKRHRIFREGASGGRE